MIKVELLYGMYECFIGAQIYAIERTNMIKKPQCKDGIMTW